MAGLEIPLPTESPQDDPGQYTPLLLSAIEGFLLARDVWQAVDYPEAYNRMQELMEYVVQVMEAVLMPSPPIGSIVMWPNDAPPENWYPCDGGALSRTEYPELFALVGATWGMGNGTTTFNVPSFSGRSPMMQGATDGQDFAIGTGGTHGEILHTLTTSEMPAHNHRIPRASATTSATIYTVTPNARTDVPAAIHIMSDNTGGGAAHNNVHPVVGINFIIYAGLPVV